MQFTVTNPAPVVQNPKNKYAIFIHYAYGDADGGTEYEVVGSEEYIKSIVQGVDTVRTAMIYNNARFFLELSDYVEQEIIEFLSNHDVLKPDRTSQGFLAQITGYYVSYYDENGVEYDVRVD